METLLIVLGLGLAGIDPLGLAVLLAALAGGARKAHVIVFAAMTFLGTVVMGVVFSLFGEQLSSLATSALPHINDPVWAIIELIVAGFIIYWLLSQLQLSTVDGATAAEIPKTHSSSLAGIAVSGLLFSLSAVPDPTFLATAAVASQASSMGLMVGIHALWVLISQSLLFGFSMAYLFDLHEPLIAFVKPPWERVKQPLKVLLFVSLALLALLMVADALMLFIAGEYLIQY